MDNPWSKSWSQRVSTGTPRKELGMRKLFRYRTNCSGVVAVALLLAMLASTMGAATAKAQNDPSPADREKAVQYLESTKNAVLTATKGLSDVQWNFKPAPDRWSIAEVVEHLAAAEDMLRG